tara:strand:- start:93 stop:395 length:303 start_codon:yes stop_codon:yes gene_type:complete
MGTGDRPFFYLGDGMVQKIQTGYKLYIDIIKRIIAVFVAQGLSILGAGSLVGIDVYQSALLAGIMGVAHVVEMLARKYIDDGKLTLDEVNEVFNSVPTRK